MPRAFKLKIQEDQNRQDKASKLNVLELVIRSHPPRDSLATSFIFFWKIFSPSSYSPFTDSSELVEQDPEKSLINFPA